MGRSSKSDKRKGKPRDERGLNSPFGLIGSVCKYYAWSEEAVLNMSYDKMNMYLATIPDYSPDDEDSEPGEAKAAKKSTGHETKVVNLFDYARGNV